MRLPRKVNFAALYLRKSRQDLKLEKLTNEDTLQAQRILMRNFLKDAPFPYHTFEEIVTGSSLEKRHEMKRIIEGIKQEKYDAIVVKDISRLSRGSQKDAGILYELLTQNEILIITPDRVINCTDENDLRMLRMELFLFHEEWQIIRGRMVSGRKAAAERGFFIGGPIPYGFQLDAKTKTLIPKEGEKEIVEQIFKWYTEDGFGYQRIADFLNQQQIPSPGGKQWLKTTVKRLLTNEKYAGFSIFGKTKLKGNKVKLQPKEQWTVAEMDDHLIDEELFKSAQERIQSIKVKHDPYLYKRVHPLSKLVKCSVCGKNMTKKHTKSYYTNVKGEKKTYALYMLSCCQGNISYERVLERIIDILKNFEELDEKLLLEKIQENVSVPKQEDHSLLAVEELQKRLEKLKKLRLRLYDDYAEEGIIDQDIYQTKNNQYVQQMEDIQAKIVGIQKKSEAIDMPFSINVAEFQSKIGSVLETFESLESPFQNELLHFIFDLVELTITHRTKGTRSNFELNVVLNLPFFQ
ncbi:recombinase family protein [Neobacillus cucumis]|nr:recombinase family protein [Neobacillus cucumis]